jgi:hypothetical protein
LGTESNDAQSWAGRQDRLQALAARQLFFIGGAPRSGTTWLQYLLDSHPEISCGGEGLFQKHLAEPLAALVAQRREALATKQREVFRDLGGFPLPDDTDTQHLTGTAILLALERQASGKPCRTVGEKTPENVFFFPTLKALFPHARLICMARDPRDVLCSAWHFFQAPKRAPDETAAKTAFIRLALPSLQAGARMTLDLVRRYPADCTVVTYERLRAAPATEAARLFGFLGVAAGAEIVDTCVARTSFAAMAGRNAGDARDGAFFRKGVAGDWAGTFTPAMNDMILQELGWMFPAFGWTA